ncbi:MAG: UDP-N-acetylmuramoyl-L-alanyl-D-glutamate--2,6-diaminopimelate ligase [Deltaproteobacteria bacterium]|nr:UDP-N-acetylmuramoyl-L-alanyl-D-glutamate--2,6-diaminopimelate ligase [Deltaproteobacteria bacterium]
MDLISGLAIINISGREDVTIEGIAYDSRKIAPGDLFVAVKGHAVDGHRFVKEAIQNGAVAVIMETSPKGLRERLKGTEPPAAPVLIQVDDSRNALARIAKRFYGSPFEGMNLIGITGTNGKTTTSYLLESILIEADRRPGVIGTINYRMPGKAWEAPVTTPESLDLMRTLRTMADAQVTDVVMEVSSHALDQGRTAECPFRVAVFTNISRDHLDYHHSMEAYFEVKSRLFKDLKAARGKDNTTAVLNMDDPMAGALKTLTDAPVMTYGTNEGTDVRAENIRLKKEGLRAELMTPTGKLDIRSGLMGDFNIHNIMAAVAAALTMDVPLDVISMGIERVAGVPGRMERVANTASKTLVVDYAHTPDALSKAIRAMRKHITGRMITVFGCGGDRDRGKRVEMGRVAGRLSDQVIITSDNPRTEDPSAIADEIKRGLWMPALRITSLSWTESGRFFSQ